MQVSYTVFQPDGTTANGHIEVPDDIADPESTSTSYDAIKAVMDPILGEGQWFEHVTVWWTGQQLDMFVDENGHARGLSRNEKATEIYRSAMMMGKTGLPIPKDPEAIAFVVGPAVLFEKRIWY